MLRTKPGIKGLLKSSMQKLFCVWPVIWFKNQ